MFHYLVKQRGDSRYDIHTSTPGTESYAVGSMYVACNTIITRWVKKNVPALKEQPFTSSTNNYLSSVWFEMQYFQQDHESDRQLEMKTWKEECQSLLKRDDFGFELDQDNHWMDEDLKLVVAGASNSEDEIKKIFHYVRDNFHCTDNSALYGYSSLKKTYLRRNQATWLN